MKSIIIALLNPKKVEKNSMTNKILNPRIPAYALILLKMLLRSITTEMMMPATSERKNPKKVPGVWL